MYFRILIPALLLMICVGCSSPEKLTPEAEKLKANSPDEYSKILAMSDDELVTSMKALSAKLTEMRSTLPPSLGQSKVGPGQPAPAPTEPESDDDGVDQKTVKGDSVATLQSLALPLEVMRQEQDRRSKK